MREVLACGGPDSRPLGASALRASLGEPPVMDPLAYHALLAGRASTIDIWSTEYVQVLDRPARLPDGVGPADTAHPVLEWVRSTGLRPVLEGLGDADRARFLAAYRSRLDEAYPLDSDGRAVYPFPRLFIVATR